MADQAVIAGRLTAEARQVIAAAPKSLLPEPIGRAGWTPGRHRSFSRRESCHAAVPASGSERNLAAPSDTPTDSR